MEPPLKILLADHHVMFRRGIRRIIGSFRDVEVVGEAGDGFELLELLKKFARPDHNGHIHAQSPGSGGD